MKWKRAIQSRLDRKNNLQNPGVIGNDFNSFNLEVEFESCVQAALLFI